MTSRDSELPPIARRRLDWFTRYVDFYLRRNFHGLHLLRLSAVDELAGWPLLVCLNHPAWWDPLVGLYLSQRFFHNRVQYAAIASAGLTKYRFFERLGFFGIEPATRAGAAKFLRIGQTVLGRSDGALWLTPQGEFVDVRKRPVHIQPGVGHLAHRATRFAMLPVAVEYSFWNERYPEVFACIGNPQYVDLGNARSPAEWNRVFELSLEATQNALAERVLSRDLRLFEPLLAGNAGVGGLYDLWRSVKSRLQGKQFEPQHGGN